MDPVASAPPRRLKQLLRAIATGVIGAALLLTGSLWWFQERLIYRAPRYASAELSTLPAGLSALRDPALPESIVGFYRAPIGAGLPRRLWLFFGGNGDVALRWDPLISPSVTNDIGLLMVEYPGYGARAGTPSPESLLAGTEATLQALAVELKTSVAELEPRVAVVGYSIGSAAALLYAAHHPAQRIILFSPFTSMLAMARRNVGWPLCNLLRHRYDNEASLRLIRAKGMPKMTILHGEHDGLIPYQMGQTLAAEAAGSELELVPDAGHGDVIDVAQARLRALLAQP